MRFPQRLRGLSVRHAPRELASSASRLLYAANLILIDSVKRPLPRPLRPVLVVPTAVLTEVPIKGKRTAEPSGGFLGAIRRA